MRRDDAAFDVIDAQRLALRCVAQAEDATLDHGLIPRAAVLLVQKEEVSGVVGAGIEAGGIEEHKREEGVCARLLCSGMLCDECKSLAWDDTHSKCQPMRFLNASISASGARETASIVTSRAARCGSIPSVWSAM